MSKHLKNGKAFQRPSRVDRLRRRLEFFTRLLATTVVWLLTFHPAALYAQQPKPTEYQIKATYLYNFGRFVKWPVKAPVEKDGSFAVCVLGQDPFGATLNSIFAGESLDNKPVVIKRISKPQDISGCQILYIHSAQENHLKEIFDVLDHEAILTVSDMPGFSRRGGMIQFVAEGERIRFEVNLASAEGAGLTLSSELLKVATAVRRNSQPGD